MVVPISECFGSYVEAALVRLRYLYPATDFTLTPQGIEVLTPADVSPETLLREVHYALYREKIFAETLPMRRALVGAVTHR